MEASCIDYKDTGSFSPTVIDYLENNPELRSFYSYRPDLKGFAELFENKKVIADRDVLVKVLNGQYERTGIGLLAFATGGDQQLTTHLNSVIS